MAVKRVVAADWMSVERQPDWTNVLIRAGIQDHLRAMCPFWTNNRRALEAAGNLPEHNMVLAHTYFHTTDGCELFLLYRLAMQGNLVAGGYEREGNTAVVSVADDTCLRQMYGDQWTRLPTKLQKHARKDFRGKMRVGLILVTLVAEFGAGILLTCAPKFHQM